jgi:hypothetical protein
MTTATPPRAWRSFCASRATGRAGARWCRGAARLRTHTTRRRAARHRDAGIQWVRSRPADPRGAGRQGSPADRDHRLGPGFGQGALTRSRVRSPSHKPVEPESLIELLASTQTAPRTVTRAPS